MFLTWFQWFPVHFFISSLFGRSCPLRPPSPSQLQTITTVVLAIRDHLLVRTSQEATGLTWSMVHVPLPVVTSSAASRPGLAARAARRSAQRSPLHAALEARWAVIDAQLERAGSEELVEETWGRHEAVAPRQCSEDFLGEQITQMCVFLTVYD